MLLVLNRMLDVLNRMKKGVDVTLDLAPDEGQSQLRSPEVTDLG